MPDNTGLTQAKKQKKDEYYTQLGDIEDELGHYEHHFNGKTIYCNCDDPYESNFFRYFASNFNHLGLKRLLTTTYAGSFITGEQLSLDDIEGLKREREREAYSTDIRHVADFNDDGRIDLKDVEHLLRHDANTTRILAGDGDFRSGESVQLLEQSDIVVTNPPFSLFRQYLAQLVEHEKQFLILGNKNCITYKAIYPLIGSNYLWLGVTPMGKDLLFDVPPHVASTLQSTGKEGSKYRIVDGTVKARTPSAWFTNLDHHSRHEELTLVKQYNPDQYPHYDNYDAINVETVATIPQDWDGEMGVPLSFLGKYNPEQFEIVRFRKGNDNRDLRVNGEDKYFRIVIRRRRS